MSGIREITEGIAVYTDKEEILENLPRFFDTSDDALNQLVQSFSNELILFRDSVEYDLIKQMSCENATSSSLDKTIDQLNIGRISWWFNSEWHFESDDHYEERALKFSTYGGNLYTTDFLRILINDVISASGITNTYDPEIVIDPFPSMNNTYDGSINYGDSNKYYMSFDTTYGYMIDVVLADIDAYYYVHSNRGGVYYILDYLDKIIKRILPVGHNYIITFYTVDEIFGNWFELSCSNTTIEDPSLWGEETDTPPGVFIHYIKDVILGNTLIDHSGDFPDPAHWVWTLWRTYLEL